MWSHYGEEHFGICLKFKTYPSNDKIALKLIDLKASKEARLCELEAIRYESKFPEFNFVEHIAKFPLTYLEQYWLTDGERKSKFYESYQKYKPCDFWDNFRKISNIKHSDWRHEQEYRYSISTHFYGERNEPKDRLLSYDFQDLDGVILGLKISPENKRKVVEILQEKCKNLGRKDFNLCETSYSNISGKIELIKNLNFNRAIENL
jgi:hypothetical protein